MQAIDSFSVLNAACRALLRVVVPFSFFGKRGSLRDGDPNSGLCHYFEVTTVDISQ